MRAAALGLAALLAISCTTAAPSPATGSPASRAAPAPPDASASSTASPSPRAVGKGRLESHTFSSAVLRRTLPYFAYLPGGYDEAVGARYPVLYLLHGGGGSNREWIDYGLIDAADRLIGSGSLPPFIIVLPQGDQEYWVDHVVDRATGANGEKWGTYTAKEVVPEMDRRYRTLARPEARAVGGLSMGAHGALQLTISFPGVWSIVGAHSPSLRPLGDAPTYLGTSPAQFAERDPAQLIKAHPEIARGLTYWIDSATLDPWIVPVTALHDELTGLGIAHEWHTAPGGHDAFYWSANMDAYLRYYAGALCGARNGCPAAP